MRIAEQFHLEFDHVAKVVSMTNAIGNVTALTFEYGRGKGLYNLVRAGTKSKHYYQSLRIWWGKKPRIFLPVKN